MEKLMQEFVEFRMENNLPYLWVKIVKTPSLFPEIKDEYRAITGVNPDGSIFSGNKLILKDEWEGLYNHTQEGNYVPFVC